MLIKSVEKTKVVDEFTFYFASALVIERTVDPALGDEWSSDGTSIVIKTAPRPSVTDPDLVTPGEHAEFFFDKMNGWEHRQRTVPVPDASVQAAWRADMKTILESN